MIEVRNPRTGVVDYSFAPPSTQELRFVTEVAREAQGSWAKRGVVSRGQALLAWREQMLESKDALVAALESDTGRRIESVLEVDAVLSMLQRWADIAPGLLERPESRPASIPIFQIEQDFVPYQLVGVISPWNFPLLLGLIDAIPALAAGCAVVIKPSEITPRFVETVNATIPKDLADLVTFVSGGPSTGQDLVEMVDLVCFTGSVATGRKVVEACAERFIPSFLELGGKDAAIVVADADLDRASSAILWGATANAGQSCLSIERVYVEESVAEEFIELLRGKADAVTLAAPKVEDGLLGPIIAERQASIIEEHLRDALSKGAKALTGGTLETIGGGQYLLPTVLIDVDHTMKVMTEETFGPIIPVMPVASAEEAIALANSTDFGLSGAVFSSDPAVCRAIAHRLQAGAVSINDAALTALVHDAEKQSFKLSGMGGSRMGPSALVRFGRKQAHLIANSVAPDPWWYPHLQ